MPTLRSLGPGLLSSIATYLDVHSLCRLEITCRRLREDLDQGVAWQAATARIACGPQPESVAVATAKLPAPSSNLSRRRSSRLVERNPMMGKKSFLAHGKKTVERTINALLEVNSIAESARQVKLGAKLRRILKRWGPVLINYTNHIDTFLTTVCNWDTSEATIIASVRYLVRTMGADVNVAPDFSPLCLAAARGFPNLIKFFLELGADPTVKGRGSIKIKGTIVTGEYDALGWARAALAITGSKRDEYIVQMLEKASAAVASAAVVSLTPTAVLNEEDKKGRKSSEQPAHSPCEPGNKMVMPKVWSVGRIVVVKYGSGAGRGIKWPALIWDEDILCDEVLNARGKNGKEKISVRFIGDNRQFGWVQDKDVFAFREEYARGDGRAGETQVPTVKLQRAYDHARRLRAGEQLKEYENWEVAVLPSTATNSSSSTTTTAATTVTTVPKEGCFSMSVISANDTKIVLARKPRRGQQSDVNSSDERESKRRQRERAPSARGFGSPIWRIKKPKSAIPTRTSNTSCKPITTEDN